MSFDFTNFQQAYEAMSHFDRENGLRNTVHAPGDVTVSMTVLEKHLSSPNVCHGGALAAMMDAVIGYAALTSTIPDGNLVSTVEFKMNYLKPLYLGDELTGRGEVVRKGRTLVVSKGEIRRGEEIVGIGQGTFNVYSLDKRSF